MEVGYAIDERPRQLRVYHIPNVPREPYYVDVFTIHDAIQILNALAYYDLYLGEELIGSNVQGLLVLEDGEWCEWQDKDGHEIRDLINDQDQNAPAKLVDEGV